MVAVVLTWVGIGLCALPVEAVQLLCEHGIKNGAVLELISESEPAASCVVLATEELDFPATGTETFNDRIKLVRFARRVSHFRYNDIGIDAFMYPGWQWRQYTGCASSDVSLRRAGDWNRLYGRGRSNPQLRADETMFFGVI